MDNHPAYIVQAQVLKLGDRPFSVQNVRSNFKKIFNDKKSFTNYRKEILAPNLWVQEHVDKRQMDNAPFIRNLGPICFNPRTGRVEKNDSDKVFIVEFFGGGSAFYKPEDAFYAKYFESDEEFFSDVNFFGFDHTLDDQRMNHLFFELIHPLFIKATFNNEIMADGKIFLHIYPIGYIVLLLAISIKNQDYSDLKKIYHATLETFPYYGYSSWEWSCKIGDGRLSEIIDKVIGNIEKSIFTSESGRVKKSEWYYAVKLMSDAQEKKVADRLFGSGTFEGGFEIRRYGAVEGYLLFSKRAMIRNFFPSQFRNRKKLLRSFWRYFALFELLILKKCIYEDYCEHIRSEIIKLREYRLSPLTKAKREDILKFSVYDSNISKHLYTLDKYTRTLSPLYRAIYSSISSNIGFDNRREKLKNLVKDWENEVEKWEHGIKMLWKKIISPVKSFLE